MTDEGMHSNRTAIVTGANGFIGSYLVQILLHRGWTVYALGRSAGGVASRNRILAAVESASTSGKISNLNCLHCCEADFSRADLGLKGQSAITAGSDAVLVHLAGDTRFVPPNEEEQRRINVDGTLNAIRALRPFISYAVHVSTAYVAGKRTGLILEDETDLGQSFHNNYEKTKLEAEIRIRSLCEQFGLPLAIARPSIIVNDTANGRSSAFTHLNVLVEVVTRIQEHYGIGDGEVVNREIRIPVDPLARPNIAPVDPIAESLARIAASPHAAGKTYHLCHPSPQTNHEIFSLVMRAFDIHDKIPLRFVQELKKPLTRTEDTALRAFRVYLPYLNYNATFDCSHTRDIIPSYDGMFGPAGVEYLRKVIAFERAGRRK